MVLLLNLIIILLFILIYLRIKSSNIPIKITFNSKIFIHSFKEIILVFSLNLNNYEFYLYKFLITQYTFCNIRLLLIYTFLLRDLIFHQNNLKFVLIHIHLFYPHNISLRQLLFLLFLKQELNIIILTK